MKKLAFGFLIFTFAITGCKGKYSDVRNNLEKTKAETEKHLAAFKKVKSAEDVVKAYNDYIDGIKPLVMEWYELEEKYPEIKDIFSNKKKERPPELKDILDEMDRVNAEWGNVSLSTIKKYMANRPVMKVLERSKELFPSRK